MGSSLTSKMMFTPPRGPFSVRTRVAVLSKKVKRQQGLVVTLDCGFVVRITGPGLDVVKNVVLAQTTITDDVDTFDDSLLGLLGYYASRRYEGCGDTNQ